MLHYEDESMENWWNDGDGVITRGGGSACSTAAVSATNLTQTGPASNPSLRSDRSASSINITHTHST
jgi:hypothetical protein